ncbi:unnamed protein product, partial [Musa textilis]
MAVAVGVVAALGDARVVLGGGKRRFKSLYLRLRAEIRRQLAKGRESKQRFSFHYDPFSYALNFDDGCPGFILHPQLERGREKFAALV